MSSQLNKRIPALFAFIIIIVGLGFVISLMTASNIPEWHNTLNHPSFSPPNWLFAPVWTILYILIGISGWLIYRKGQFKGPNRAIYINQLVLNYAWPLIFFGGHLIGIALIEMSLLWLMIIVNIRIFKSSHKFASLLLYPYLVWVSFAWVLNLVLWLHN